MNTWRRLALVVAVSSLAWVNCTTQREDTRTLDQPMSWAELMHDVIGPGYDKLLRGEARKSTEDMDLGLVARTARELAPHVALGYGRCVDTSVEGFADYARETEQWLIEIAEEAEAGHAARVRDVIKTGGARYCERCHEAYVGGPDLRPASLRPRSTALSLK